MPLGVHRPYTDSSSDELAVRCRGRPAGSPQRVSGERGRAHFGSRVRACAVRAFDRAVSGVSEATSHGLRQLFELESVQIPTMLPQAGMVLWSPPSCGQDVTAKCIGQDAVQAGHKEQGH